MYVNKFIKSIFKYIILFLIGGATYFLIEILWRGYSHWTMFLIGGLCFVSVGLINNVFPWEMKIELQSIIGSVLITTLEFIVGVIVNIHLKWNVWDYSDLPFNILGQVCLPFTMLWMILSFVIIILDDKIRYKFFNEKEPTYVSFFMK